MTWEPSTARDLRKGRTFVVKGELHASARKVTGDATTEGEAVTFPARALWAYAGETDTAVTLDASTAVYILNCTCNGMGFIANRWVFTGECSCRHHALPKEN